MEPGEGLETITQATEAIWTTAFLVLRMRKQVLKAASQEGVYPQNQMSITTKSTPVTGGPRQTQNAVVLLGDRFQSFWPKKAPKRPQFISVR